MSRISVQKVAVATDVFAGLLGPCPRSVPAKPHRALWNAPPACAVRQAQHLHKAMKRVLIPIAFAFSVSAVVAFDPMSDLPAPAQGPALRNAGWFSDDDGWAIVAAVVAMAIIAKRRKR